jgi:hypothetical protein
VALDILAALQNVERQGQQSGDEFQILCAFTRAAALDRQQRHDEAWKNLVEANASEYAKHQSENKRSIERQIASRKFAKEQPVELPSEPSAAPLSLFIVGPSRSGKTTLERLISTLDGIKQGYESHLVDRAVRRASQLSGLLTLSTLTDLPKSLDSEFRKHYLEELHGVAGTSKIFTNTHPGMIHSVGRVALALSNSRFIFVKRDVHDLVFRIFGKKYKSGNFYSYSVKTIVDYISWYNEMIDIWCEKLPAVTRVIHYEGMIADPRSALQAVADLCGVPMPDTPLPELGDDRGCAAPYREMMDAALR